jgi:DNA-binding beta-propeller fold protein YncE
LFILVSSCVGSFTHAQGKQLLVADRLSNSVYRYDSDGTFLNKVLTDNTNLNQPTGIAISPDQTKLYVSSFQTARVIQYDYDVTSGTATNGQVFATANLASPNAIRFSHSGDTIYVSNLGGTGVAQFNLDGSTAGPPINGVIGAPTGGGMGDIFQYAGLEFTPSGELLVGGFQNFPGGNMGAIAKSNAAISEISTFIDSSTSLNGASGLLVHDGDLYVSGMFASNIQRFDVSTGALDPSFLVSGLAFPQQLSLAPDGNGFLAGILGVANGEGHIAHYDFDGNLVGDGIFANNVSISGVGFTEATAFAYVMPNLPGDFNGDGNVDGRDFLSWQRGDSFNPLSASDLADWQANYGQPTLGSAVGVPEPTAVVILLSVLLAGGVHRRA